MSFKNIREYLQIHLRIMKCGKNNSLMYFGAQTNVQLVITNHVLEIVVMCIFFFIKNY